MSNFERKVAIVGIGLAAITAALFYVQLNEMQSQTQILATQTEGALSGNLLEEMNTKRQLDIVQQQAKAAQDQARTAKDSADTAKAALIRSNRPWIGIVGVPVIANVTANRNNTFTVDLNIVAKNYGPSPALHVAVNPLADIILETEDRTKYLQEISAMENSACGLASASLNRIPGFSITIKNGVITRDMRLTVLPPMGLTMFPGEQQSFPTASDFGYRDAKELAQKYLRIVGCAAYTDQFSSGLKRPVVHHTLFCFHSPGVIKDFSPQQTLIPCLLSENAD